MEGGEGTMGRITGACRPDAPPHEPSQRCCCDGDRSQAAVTLPTKMRVLSVSMVAHTSRTRRRFTQSPVQAGVICGCPGGVWKRSNAGNVPPYSLPPLLVSILKP